MASEFVRNHKKSRHGPARTRFTEVAQSACEDAPGSSLMRRVYRNLGLGVDLCDVRLAYVFSVFILGCSLAHFLVGEGGGGKGGRCNKQAVDPGAFALKASGVVPRGSQPGWSHALGQRVTCATVDYTCINIYFVGPPSPMPRFSCLDMYKQCKHLGIGRGSVYIHIYIYICIHGCISILRVGLKGIRY